MGKGDGHRPPLQGEGDILEDFHHEVGHVFDHGAVMAGVNADLADFGEGEAHLVVVGEFGHEVVGVELTFFFRGAVLHQAIAVQLGAALQVVEKTAGLGDFRLLVGAGFEGEPDVVEDHGVGEFFR